MKNYWITIFAKDVLSRSRLLHLVSQKTSVGRSSHHITEKMLPSVLAFGHRLVPQVQSGVRVRHQYPRLLSYAEIALDLGRMVGPGLLLDLLHDLGVLPLLPLLPEVGGQRGVFYIYIYILRVKKFPGE